MTNRAIKIAALLVALIAPDLARAQTSTINPNLPAANSPLSSAPVRGNFAAAYNDINAILAGGIPLAANKIFIGNGASPSIMQAATVGGDCTTALVTGVAIWSCNVNRVGGVTYPTAPYVVGDILSADTTTTMARLAAGAIGSTIVSGGAGLFPRWSSAPNVRPAIETSYTIASTDNYVVNRNITAAVNWSLGPGIVPLTLRNDSAWYPVIVTLTGGATVNDNFTTLVLDPLQSVTLTWDLVQYRGGMSSAGRNSALGNILNMVGYGGAVGPLTATLSGTVTVGNVVGVDYTFNPGSGNVTVSLRHTMVGGDTLLTAWQDIQNQFCASTLIKNWIGTDLFNFGCSPVFTLTSPTIGWDQLYPNVTSTLTAVSGSTGIVTIGGQGNLNLDGGSAIVGGMSPRVLGRAPRVNDAIFQIYIVGDTSTGFAPVRQIAPPYGLMSWSITDPTPGALKADLQIQTNTNTILGNFGIGAKPQFLFHMTGLAASPVNQVSDSFGGTTFYIPRRAEGTPTAPTTISGASQIAAIVPEGYNGSAYVNPAAITFRATQAFSGTQNGGNIGFLITPNNTTTQFESARMDQDGVLKLAGVSGAFGTTLPAPINGGVELQLIGPAATATGMEIVSYGAGSFFYGRSFGGTPGTPAALTSGATIAAFDAQGYNGTSTIDTGTLSFSSSQIWAVGATGSRAGLFTTLNGTSTQVERQRWENDGGITIPPTVTGGSCGAGCINATAIRVANAPVLTGNQTITLSGDFSGSGTTTIAGTLNTVNANVGSFGSATQSGTFTVNAKGLITAAAGVTVTPAVGSITGLGAGVATFLATPSSANLASAITDETGTGPAVFANNASLTTPTFVTSFLSPLHIGGGGAASTLTLQSTSNVGTTDAIIFQTGSQVERARFLTGGNFGLGTNNPQSLLHVSKNTTQNVAAASSAIAQFVNVDGTPTDVQLNAFGTGIFPRILMRQSRGTAASQTATGATDLLFLLSAQGWDATNGFVTSGAFHMTAASLFTATSHETYASISTTPNGSISTGETVRVFGSGCLAVGGAFGTDCGVGSILANVGIQTVATTVAGLPTCTATLKGTRRFVTDANANTFHTTVAGGGANNVGTTCDGANWYISANDNMPENLRRKFA